MLTAENYFERKSGIGEKLNSEFYDRAKEHLSAAANLIKHMNPDEKKALESFVINSLMVK